MQHLSRAIITRVLPLFFICSDPSQAMETSTANSVTLEHAKIIYNALDLQNADEVIEEEEGIDPYLLKQLKEYVANVIWDMRVSPNQINFDAKKKIFSSSRGEVSLATVLEFSNITLPEKKKKSKKRESDDIIEKLINHILFPKKKPGPSIEQIRSALSRTFKKQLNKINYDEYKKTFFIQGSQPLSLEQAIDFTGLKGGTVGEAGFEYVANQNEVSKRDALKLSEVRDLLVQRAHECIEEEVKHPDKFVMYHSVTTWNAFWVEIVTRVKTHCESKGEDCPIKIFRDSQELEESNDIETFRRSVFKGLETALNPDPLKLDDQYQLERNDLAVVLKTKNMQNDQTSKSFQGTVLSLSPTFFSGYSKANEAALGFWVNGFAPYHSRLMDSHVKKELVNIPTAFLKKNHVNEKYHSGIIREIQQAYLKLFPLPGEGVEARTGGVLFQFFVNPIVVDKYSYISAPFGFRVAKNLGGKYLTDQPSSILTLLKENMGKYIQLNKDNEYTDPLTKVQLCPNGDSYDLGCTQIRLLPKFDLLQDRNLVSVKMYFLDNPSENWKLRYNTAVDHIASLILEAMGGSSDTVDQEKPQASLESEQSWHHTLGMLVKPYFTKEYEDRHYFTGEAKGHKYQEAEDDRRYVVIREDGQKVFRPNHGLAHSLRKGFLAKDIIDAFVLAAQKQDYFTSQEAKSLMEWIVTKVKKDANFIQKMELVSAYQRSGRQSEIEGNDDHKEGKGARKSYIEYARRDAENFHRDVMGNPLLLNLFNNSEDEVLLYSNALRKDLEHVEYETIMISKIISTTHMLDILRLTIPGKIVHTIHSRLFGPGEGEGETAFINILMEREAQYLEATGDTEKVRTKGFFDMALEPEVIIQVLEKVQANPITLK